MWSDLCFEKLLVAVWGLTRWGARMVVRRTTGSSCSWQVRGGRNLDQCGSKRRGEKSGLLRRRKRQAGQWRAESAMSRNQHVPASKLDGWWLEENNGTDQICRVDDDELGAVTRSVPTLPCPLHLIRKLYIHLAYWFSSFFSGDIELLWSQLLLPFALGE